MENFVHKCVRLKIGKKKVIGLVTRGDSVGVRQLGKRKPESAGGAASASVISDVCLYREGLAAVLENSGWIRVIGAITEAGLKHRPSPLPDIVLIDASLLSGRAHLLESELLAGTKIIAFSVSETEQTPAVGRSPRLSGFLGSNATAEEIISMIEVTLREAPSSS